MEFFINVISSIFIKVYFLRKNAFEISTGFPGIRKYRRRAKHSKIKCPLITLHTLQGRGEEVKKNSQKLEIKNKKYLKKKKVEVLIKIKLHQILLFNAKHKNVIYFHFMEFS